MTSLISSATVFAPQATTLQTQTTTTTLQSHVKKDLQTLVKRKSLPNVTSLPTIIPRSTAAGRGVDIPKKPIRPLTAYHIFFQIEREYVIQTMEGELANKSMMDNKILLDDVPQRYKNIRLLPDWYAGPGKRGKRKHRKQHGKIGFLELSRVVSERWAKLHELDPETKAFVQKIAKSEVEEYYREIKIYKEKIKHLLPEEKEMTSAAPTKKRVPKKRSISDLTDLKLDTSSTPAPHRLEPRPVHQQHQMQQQMMAIHHPGMVSSSTDMFSQEGCGNNNFMPPISAQMSQDIDFFLAKCVGGNHHQAQHLLNNNSQQQQQMLPSLPFYNMDANNNTVYNNNSTVDSPYNPVSIKKQKMFNGYSSSEMCPPIASNDSTLIRKCTISPSSSMCASPSSSMYTNPVPVPSDSEVDLLDDEIMQLWKASHME